MLDLNEIAGLPAHPLLLHVPVVLIPILSGATIALMVRPDWRRRYGVAVAVLGFVALVFTILAAGAGEAFRASRPLFASPALNEHAELGDRVAAGSGMRGALVGLRDSGEISVEVMRRIEREIDLEEERLEV